MIKRKPKVSAKMGLVIWSAILACIVATIGIVTRPTALTFKLADAAGDTPLGGFLDIAEVRLTKEKGNLILTMEACENIPTQMPKYDGIGFVYFYFLFDLDKDNFEDLTVEITIDFLGLSVSHGSYMHLGPAIAVTIPLMEIGDLRSFNLKAYSYTSGGWLMAGIHDMVPDIGWAEVLLA